MKAMTIFAVVIAVVLCFAYAAFADWKDDLEVLKAEVKPCGMYSWVDSKFFYSTSLQLLGYKGFELNGAYSTDHNMPSFNIGYEIANLQQFGVDVPIAKYVNLSAGGYVGCKDFTTDDRSTDWGLWATILKGEW